MLEDVYETSKNIQVLYLKEINDGSTKNKLFEEDAFDSIKDYDIIVDIDDVKKIEAAKKKGGHKNRYEIANTLYNKLKKLAKNLQSKYMVLLLIRDC